jgi:hypothetical protein
VCGLVDCQRLDSCACSSRLAGRCVWDAFGQCVATLKEGLTGLWYGGPSVFLYNMQGSSRAGRLWVAGLRAAALCLAGMSVGGGWAGLTVVCLLCMWPSRVQQCCSFVSFLSSATGAVSVPCQRFVTPPPPGSSAVTAVYPAACCLRPHSTLHDCTWPCGGAPCTETAS